jgi:hypothetical protein
MEVIGEGWEEWLTAVVKRLARVEAMMGGAIGLGGVVVTYLPI